MTDPRFVRLVEANLDHWLPRTVRMTDAELALLSAERSVLFHILSDGLALAQLAVKAATLVAQISHFAEKSGLVREWVPVVRRALGRVSADSPLYARLLNALGAVLAISGDLNGAIRAHETALNLAARISAHDEHAHAHFLLGNVAYRQNDLAAAEHYAQDALRLYIQHDLMKPSHLAAAYNLLGLVELGQSRLSAAQERFITACDHWEQTDQRIYHARTLLNLGTAYNRAQQFKDAVRAYQDALKRLPPNGFALEHSRINLNLGTVYYDQQQWQEALLYYQLANSPELEGSGDRPLTGMIWTSLGDTWIELDNLEEGARHLRSGLAIWEELGNDPVNLANALGALANRHAKLGQLPEAGDVYRRALALLCDHRSRNSWAQELDDKFRRRLAAIGAEALPCPA